MGLSLTDARWLVECEKRLIVRDSVWATRPPRTSKSGETHTFECRVGTAGALPRGLWFRVVLFPRYPDTATIQLECDRPDSRSHMTLYRVEWRPLSGHMNALDGRPEEFAGMRFEPGDTHEHSCLDHAFGPSDLIEPPGVHLARPISPDFQDFAQVLAHACGKLRITNGDAVPPPKDQGSFI